MVSKVHLNKQVVLPFEAFMETAASEIAFDGKSLYTHVEFHCAIYELFGFWKYD